ncbi:MAG: oligosaccharide flippase family protein [candidate division WOR-3 bacterium]
MKKENFAFNVLIRLATGILLDLKSFILLPLIAKNLGPKEYGIWTQVVVSLGLLVPILMLRLDTASIRYLPSKREEVFSQHFFSMLFLILFSLIIIILLMFFLKEKIAIFLFGDEKQILYVNLFLSLLFIRVLYTFLHNYYRILNQICKYSIIEILATFFSLLLGIIFVFWGGKLEKVILSFIIVEGFGSFLIIFDIINSKGFPLKLSFKEILPYLYYSLPLIPISILFWIVEYSDRYVIIHFLDISKVGVYSASYSLGKFVNIFLTPISFVLFPTISKLWEEKEEKEVKEYLQDSLKYYLILAIPSCFLIFYFAPYLLRLLATEVFVTKRTLILFILGGYLFAGIYQIYVSIILLKEKTKYLPFSFLFAALLNLGLNFLLVPKIDIIGAAVATFISYFFLAIIILTFSYKLFKVTIGIKFTGKIIGSSLIMLLTLRWFSPKGVLEIVSVASLGGVVYSILLILFRVIGRKELYFLKSMLKKDS